jgi:SAM-dependent methyltransferase
LIGPGRNVVELGAGSGQATGRLAAEGMHVTAVEPGPALGERLHRNFPQVTLVPVTAEQAELPQATFDVAVAATSIHWMNLAVVLPKVHKALRPNGHLVVWRNVFGDPLAVPTPFRKRIDDITARRPGPPRAGLADVDTAGWAGVLEASDLFRETHREEFRWDIRLNAAGVSDLFTTFSDWSADEVRQAAQAVRDEGGSVVEHYLTSLSVLVRV